MTDCDASQVLDRLRQALDVPSDAALAEVFGVKPNTVATWRRRNSLPYADCIRVAGEKLINLNWLFTGEGNRDDSFISGYLDVELLGMAIELKKRRYQEARDFETKHEAHLIADYYTSVAKRYAEMHRQRIARSRILAFLRHEFALPDPAEDAPQSANLSS